MPASKPFKAPDSKLPDNLKNLDYDRYRAIRFLPEQALWRGDKLPFEAQFFHRGFFYAPGGYLRGENGQATKIAYHPDLFSFGEHAATQSRGRSRFCRFSPSCADQQARLLRRDLRLSWRELFSCRRKGTVYGLSARGLAINTGEAKGEEFPVFKTFWIEKPAANANSIVVHALLDSESAAAAYRFTIRPGDTTVFDVEMAIYPRVDLDRAGLAPMTSMFFFGPNDRIDVDDFVPRCTIPMASRFSTAEARNFGGRCIIPRICRSAPLRISIRAVSA